MKSFAMPSKNFSINGLSKPYDGWEIRPKQLFHFHGKSLLCLVCYVTINREYRFTYAKFHEDLLSFKRIRFSQLIYSYCFLPVTNFEEALTVLNDLGINL